MDGCKNKVRSYPGNLSFMGAAWSLQVIRKKTGWLVTGSTLIHLGTERSPTWDGIVETVAATFFSVVCYFDTNLFAISFTCSRSLAVYTFSVYQSRFNSSVRSHFEELSLTSYRTRVDLNFSMSPDTAKYRGHTNI